MTNNQVQIIDNFLDQQDFKTITTLMESSEFPWFYNPGVIKANDVRLNQYQFTHTFYQNDIPCSNYFDLLMPLVNKINPIALLRIKANLNPRTEQIIEHGYHTDFSRCAPTQKTAVYYLNTNNGFTKFEDGTKVESIENRLVIFNTLTLHTGTTCTDVNRRLLINLNYII